MGCVLGKGTTDTPPRVPEKLKLESRYNKGGSGSRPISQELPSKEVEHVGGDGDRGGGGGGGGERNGVGENGNVLRGIIVKRIGADELVDGWPKWLVESMPREVLAGLVPRTADSYDKLAKVGQGTYSNVFKARDRETGKIVALKKVRFDTSEPESVKFMAREIIILQQLDHPNIIKLEGLATSRMQYSIYLVFDFMQSDLTRLISRQEGRLTEPQVKCYMQQLLLGLQHCHERGILHRDIKGSNLLIDRNGMLKIADFGLANYFQPKQKRPLTSRVVTLWYRAPELLLGSTDYGVGVDLWSSGCLLAEMFVGRTIMPGLTEVEQLHRIFKLCGSPSEDYWKYMKPRTTFRPPQKYKPSFQVTFTNMPSSSLNLLMTLLALEPSHRGTAASGLQNEFFSSSPLACDLSGLPTINIQEDEPTPTIDWKKKRVSRIQKKRFRKVHGGHGRKESPTELSARSSQLGRNSEINLQSQEMSSSASLTASNRKSRMRDQECGLPPFPSLAFHYNQSQIQFTKTEAHPNAMKNIKNFPLLLASQADARNLTKIEDNGTSLSQRSISNIDSRTIDQENISKLFGLED